MPINQRLSGPTRLIWPILMLAGCAGAPIQPTPAAPATSSPVPSAATSGQPTPPRTVAPTQSGEPDLYIGGTITWTAQATKQDVGLPPQIQSVTGTADIVIHVVTPYLLLAERDGGSR